MGSGLDQNAKLVVPHAIRKVSVSKRGVHPVEIRWGENGGGRDTGAFAARGKKGSRMNTLNVYNSG